MEKILFTVLCIVAVIGLSIALIPVQFFNRYVSNKVDFVLKEIDESTAYDFLKQVEDTARASVASYMTDKATYEQYKDSDNEQKQGWAEQAKMRANKTANIFNEYMRKNSFRWDGNIPDDIDCELPILE